MRRDGHMHVKTKPHDVQIRQSIYLTSSSMRFWVISIFNFLTYNRHIHWTVSTLVFFWTFCHSIFSHSMFGCSTFSSSTFISSTFRRWISYMHVNTWSRAHGHKATCMWIHSHVAVDHVITWMWIHDRVHADILPRERGFTDSCNQLHFILPMFIYFPFLAHNRTPDIPVRLMYVVYRLRRVEVKKVNKFALGSLFRIVM